METEKEVRPTSKVTALKTLTEAKVTNGSHVKVTENEEDKEVQEEDLRGLPVDHGWSWVIMAGHFVMTLVMAGYGRSLSLFLMDFVATFGASVTTVTLTFAVMTASFGLGNLFVTHVLLPRFDTRLIITAGAITASVAMVVTSFAPDMILIIFLHAVIGLAHAMMHTSSATLMGPYFKARRGLANAVSNTGVSVSALLIPPATQFLITLYGTRGALLLVAGFQMQAVVAGFLMRPVEVYVRTQKWQRLNRKTIRKYEKPEYYLSALGSAHLLPNSTDNLEDKEMIVGAYPTICDSRSPEFRTKLDSGLEYWNKFDSDLDHKTKQKNSENELLTRKNELTCSPMDSKVFSNQNNADDSKPSATSKSIERNTNISNGIDHDESDVTVHLLSKTENAQEVRTIAGNCQTEKENNISSNISAFPPDNGIISRLKNDKTLRIEEALEKSPADSEADTNGTCAVLKTSAGQPPLAAKSVRGAKWCSSCVSSVVDLSLFKNWMFILLVSYFPLGQTNAFLGVFLPSLGVEKGLSRPDAALLLTVMGAVDLVSRLCVGCLADTGLVRRTRIVAVALTILSVSCMFISMYEGFGGLAVFSVMFGLCGGTNQNLFVVVIVELLGLSHLSKALGVVLLMQCVCLSVTHPLMGALVDWTGSFTVTYYYVAACLLMSVIILTTEPLARRLEQRRQQKLKVVSTALD